MNTPATPELLPAVIQVRVIFEGGEAWKDYRVLRWTERQRPVIRWDGMSPKDGSELIVGDGDWRAF